MHIFNHNSKPSLIITDKELLFRDKPTDEAMQRHPFTEIESITIEHRYDAKKELFVWLKVKMNALSTPLLIQVSSLDTPLEEIFTILKDELEGKIKLSLLSAKELKPSNRGKKIRLSFLIILLIFSAFIFHKFSPPSLNTLADTRIKAQYENSMGVCSVNAKAAFKTQTKDRIEIKHYCGLFGLWKESETKEISLRHLETEFAPFKLQDYLNQAQGKYKKGKYEQALKSIENAFYLDPQSPQAYLMLGKIHYHLEHKDRAFDAFKEAHQLNSSSVLILNTMVYYYIKEQKYTEAYPYAQKALALQAQKSELISIAIIESKIGKEKSAIDHLKKSLYLEDNNTFVLTQLGLLYWQDKNYEETKKVFQQASVVEPEKSGHFLNYYEVSLATQALPSSEEIESFESLNKDNQSVLMTYDMLKIIQLSIKEEDIMPSLKAWDINYSGNRLNWSFTQILSWLDSSSMNEDKKHNIKKTIGFFIAYQQIYNLEHQQDQGI